MSKDRSPISNVFSYGGYTAMTTLAMFALHLVAARYLGVEDFGRFSFALAFVTLFAPLIDPGLYYLIIREVARKKELSQHYVSHALTWKLLCTPILLVLVYLVVRYLHDSSATIQIVCLMAVAHVLLSLKDTLRPLLLAHELFNLDALTLGIERFSLLIFVTITLVAGYGLLGIGLTFIVVRLVDLTIIAAIVRRKIGNISIGRDLGFVRKIVMDAVPIGAFYITLTIYNYIDTVMLSVLADNKQVGWYSASYKLYEGPILIPSIFATVFMPRLSRLYHENRDQFAQLFKQGLRYIVLISVLVGANGFILAEPLISLSFGTDFSNSILALQILLSGLAFIFTITFLQTVMISVDRQNLILVTAVLGLALNVAFNAVLIPLYGYIGAAVATITVEGIVCIVLCVAVHRQIANTNWLHHWVKPVVAGILSVATVQLLAVTIGVFSQLLLLNSLLICLTLVLGVFSKHELSTMVDYVRAKAVK